MIADGHYEDIAEFALKVAGKDSYYAEVYLEDDSAFSFAIEQGMLNGSASAKKLGIRIRLIRCLLYTSPSPRD